MNITISGHAEAYCGVFNIDTVITSVLIVHIKNSELTAIDVGNDYLNRFNKEKIYTVTR